MRARWWGGDATLCWEGPFSPIHKRVSGERQEASPKTTTIGVRAVGGEVRFFFTYFPNTEEELGDEG